MTLHGPSAASALPHPAPPRPRCCAHLARGPDSTASRAASCVAATATAAAAAAAARLTSAALAPLLLHGRHKQGGTGRARGQGSDPGCQDPEDPKDRERRRRRAAATEPGTGGSTALMHHGPLTTMMKLMQLAAAPTRVPSPTLAPGPSAAPWTLTPSTQHPAPTWGQDADGSSPWRPAPSSQPSRPQAPLPAPRARTCCTRVGAACAASRCCCCCCCAPAAAAVGMGGPRRSLAACCGTRDGARAARVVSERCHAHP